MTPESLARTIAKARHGTDAYWANYLRSARAVLDDFDRLAAETNSAETALLLAGIKRH